MTQTRIDGDVQAIEDWYLLHVRPFLQRIARLQLKASRIEDFDAELERLTEARAAYNDDLVACFLGVAGIGKSTLINALVDGRRSTLPHGGIGPLTAQALSVRRGSPPGFQVTYHPPGQVWKLVMALEWGFKGQLHGPPSGPGPATSIEPSESDLPEIDLPENEPLDREQLQEIREVARGGEDGDSTRIQSYRKQAQLLVRGSQESEAEVSYLVDALRTTLGKAPKWGTTIGEEDLARIGRLRDALAAGKAERQGSVSDGRFREELEAHATGFLAPLILEMSVTCDTEMLPDGVVLVDLPGLGVAGDIHKEITSRWVREQARSIILVVGHRGIQEAEAQLLQESGFLNRLIYSADNPADDPVSLMVVVVRVDEIAGAEYRVGKEAGIIQKKKQEYFAEACERARKLVLAQLKPELEKAWASGEIQDVQVQVIDHLISNLEVHPVSAVEYTKCLLDDPDVRSFLSEPGRSNIPSLLAVLKDQRRSRRQAEVRRLEEILLNFRSRLDTTLRVIQAQWMEDTRATEEAERLREEFLVFLDPLREEYRSRQGAYREFLRETLPQTIRAEVVKASNVARKEINSYLRPLEEVGWKALQATVVRGGRFVTGVSRKIDLPNDFALRFEVPVAEAWAKCVLKEIRRRTKDFADDCVRLVDQVVEWAKAQGSRIQPRLVEAQRDAIRADTKALEAVGRTMVDQLRKEVNSRLTKKIEGPIRQRCKRFVDNDEHRGSGTKQRMLDLFARLADEVTETAAGPAEEVLLDAFRKVETEILEVFRKYADPLEAAKDAIVEAHETYVKRSDAQRRRQVLADVESVLGERPDLPTEDEQTQAA